MNEWLRGRGRGVNKKPWKRKDERVRLWGGIRDYIALPLSLTVDSCRRSLKFRLQQLQAFCLPIYICCLILYAYAYLIWWNIALCTIQWRRPTSNCSRNMPHLNRLPYDNHNEVFNSAFSGSVPVAPRRPEGRSTGEQGTEVYKKKI